MAFIQTIIDCFCSFQKMNIHSVEKYLDTFLKNEKILIDDIMFIQCINYSLLLYYIQLIYHKNFIYLLYIYIYIVT